MTQTTSLLAAAAATAVLVGAHLAIPALRRRTENRSEAVVAAVGGGVAVAYVFLHLLPEIARGNVEIAELIGDESSVSPLGEIMLFAVAFAGFLTLYGLDHVAVRANRANGVFAVHLGAYATYNGLITYSLPLQFRTGVLMTVMFVVAMGIHFILSDRALAEHYGESFRSVGRPVLIAALCIGMLLAWLFAPTRTTVVSVVLAALSGFVLYNVFRDELPSEERVRFKIFAASAAAYASVLTAITALEAG